MYISLNVFANVRDENRGSESHYCSSYAFFRFHFIPVTEVKKSVKEMDIIVIIGWCESKWTESLLAASQEIIGGEIVSEVKLFRFLSTIIMLSEQTRHILNQEE